MDDAIIKELATAHRNKPYKRAQALGVSKETKERLELARRYFYEMLERAHAAQADLVAADSKLRDAQNAWESEFLRTSC